jgi:hypothetical protein
VIAGVGVAHGEGTLRGDQFASRWNARRAIPPDAEPAASAAASALSEAGWWRPGSGAPCAGGLVVANDGMSRDATARFARELSGAWGSAPPPSGFLFSLPSSTAAVLGILFGLPEYQSTLVGPAAGIDALRHALDLLSLGRLERALVVVGSARGAERVAVAWCLDPRSPDPWQIDCGFPESIAGPTMSHPPPAAEIFLRASEAIARRETAAIRLEAPDGGWIRLLRTEGARPDAPERLS